MDETKDNPFLKNNFSPLSSEIESTQLEVKGSIPKDLNGLLIRNTPNPVVLPDEVDKYHWFAGDGMLHGIYLENGKAVKYKNRFVRTRYLASRSNFEAPPGPDEPINGPANTHVYFHGGKLLALCESSLPHLINLELETLCVYDFNGKLKPPMTAHPKTDPLSGDLCFFGYNPFGPPYLRYHVADKNGVLKKSIEIKTPACSMMHDFAITKNYAVFLDLPVLFSINMAMNGYQIPFCWQPENGSRIGILPRNAESDQTIWIEIDTCYVFHVFNAFEENNQIKLYLISYEKMFDLNPGELLGSAPPKIELWTINLETLTFSREQLFEDAVEFPRINESNVASEFRYGYVASLNEQLVYGTYGGPGQVLKIDFHNKSITRLLLGKHIGTGEPVFVNCGSNEDDGYLLTVGYDRIHNKSKLFIHDATASQSLPIATVTLPQRVPYGFHGSFVSF